MRDVAASLLAIIRRAASCEAKMTPFTLVAICSSISSGVKSTKGFGRKMPALLTSRSTWPKRSIALSKRRFEVWGLAMSPATPEKRSPAPSSVAASSSRGCVRALPTTFQLRPSSAFAMPRPMPLEAPVTTAVLRCAFMIDSFQVYGACRTLRRRGINSRFVRTPGELPSYGRHSYQIRVNRPRYRPRVVLAGLLHVRARSSKASRSLGNAKSTNARTFGTERRPCGETRCTGSGACSSSARMIFSVPSATASLRWYENMRTTPRPHHGCNGGRMAAATRAEAIRAAEWQP